MNQIIADNLVTPVRLELAKTTILDGRDDSWWNTIDYWKEKELDGVRAIIFYTISDSTKVLDAVRLHMKEDLDSFLYHNEVSSLLVKIAYLFPSECLKILNELILDYKTGMKIFNPYGDNLYSCLFEKLPKNQIDNLQLNLINFLRKEDCSFLNWSPILNVLYKNGEIKYLEKAIKDNQSKFKPIDIQGYFSVIIQVKAKVYGFIVYSELIEIIRKNQENNSRKKFALYAIQNIVKNHKLNAKEINEIKKDLSSIIMEVEIKEIVNKTIESLN